MAFLEPDTRVWLSILHRGGAYGYWWTAQGLASDWWEIDRQAPLPSGRRDIYVGVHPTNQIPETNTKGKVCTSRDVRSQIKYIAAVNCLFGEWDAKDHGNSKESAADALRAIEPPASVVIDSGGGWHAYWLLDEPWILKTDADRDRASKIQAAWVRHVGSDKSSKDIARVLRVPGRLNHKYTPPRQVAFRRKDFDTRYALDDLTRRCEYLIEPDQPSTAHTTTTNGNGNHTAYADRALANEIATVIRALDGGKHDQIRNSAISLGTLIPHGLLTEDEVEASLFAAVVSRAKDPKNAAATIRDGIEYGKARPRELPERPAPALPDDESDMKALQRGVYGPILPLFSMNLPIFPTEVFPPWLRAYVEAQAEEKQVPADLPAMLALAILSAACARYVMVQVQPGWREPVNVYTLVSLPPGNRKSPIFSAMTDPLVEHERRAVIESKDDMLKFETQRDIAKQRLEAAKRKASSAIGNEATLRAMDEVDRLVADLAAITPTEQPRLVVDDVTTEQLASLLVQQGGRIAALSPEGGDIFSIMAGRYSDGAPNFGIYLKAHSGEDIRIDRKGRPSEFAERPALTMGLTVQPSILQSLANSASFRGRGLLARFLFAIPRSMIGSRNVEPDQCPAAVLDTYRMYVGELLTLAKSLSSSAGVGGITGNSDNCGDSSIVGLRYKKESIYILSFSPVARALLLDFERWLEPQMKEGAGSISDMSDWSAKLVGAVVRIAGLLHMSQIVDHNSHYSQIIEEHTIARALTVATYLIAHARAAFAEINADDSIGAARRVLKWLEDRQVLHFTKREAYQGLKGTFKRADELDPVLALLCDHGYIQAIDMDDRANMRGRKPSQIFDVNPVFYAKDYDPVTRGTEIVYPFAMPDFTQQTVAHTNGRITPASRYKEVEGY